MAPGYLRVDRPQRSSSQPPCLYGFIPRTYCGPRVAALSQGAQRGDGDPLDALVLLEDPVYPGVWVEARPVGVLYMHDEAGEDAKLICVPPKEPRFSDVYDLADLTPQLVQEIQHFFNVYKELEPNKHSSASGMGGKDAAWKEIESSRAAFPGH